MTISIEERAARSHRRRSIRKLARSRPPDSSTDSTPGTTPTKTAATPEDFSEHRPYNPGDDLRSLDWKIYARTDRLVIKQFEEQTNVGAVLALDASETRWDFRMEDVFQNWNT